MGWAAALAAVGFDARAAAAHVKWFSHYSFADPPRPLGAVVTPTFWALMALSVVTVAALVPLDRRLERASWYQRLNEWLEARAYQAPTLLRIGIGAGLLLIRLAVARRVWREPVGLTVLVASSTYLFGSLFLHGSQLRIVYMLAGTLIALAWATDRASPAAET